RGDPTRLAGLLVDTRARVRTAAALGLALVDPRALHRATRARLALLASRDPEPAVRAAARRALARDRDAGPLPDAPGMFLRRTEPYPWRDPPRWIEVDDGPQRLWLPAEGSGPWRWALVPGLAHAVPRAEAQAEPVIAPDEDPLFEPCAGLGPRNHRVCDLSLEAAPRLQPAMTPPARQSHSHSNALLVSGW